MPAQLARFMWNCSRMVAVVRESAARAQQELARAERDGDSSVDELVGLGRLTARLQDCPEEADAAMAELWRIADVLSPGVREPTPEGSKRGQLPPVTSTWPSTDGVPRSGCADAARTRQVRGGLRARAAPLPRRVDGPAGRGGPKGGRCTSRSFPSPDL